MTRVLDRKLVEEALREAAWKARYGTQEERSGRFIPPRPEERPPWPPAAEPTKD